MSTINYLLYKMPQVSTNLWLPTIHRQDANNPSNILWRKNGNKVTLVTPAPLHHIFENGDNSYQWIMYRAQDNIYPNGWYKIKDEPSVALIGDVETNLPGIMNSLTPIAEYDDLYAVPDDIAVRVLSSHNKGGNLINGNAQVDVNTATLRGGNIHITGNANITSSTIRNYGYHESFPRVEDYSIRNSEVVLDYSGLLGSGSIVDSRLVRGAEVTNGSLNCDNATISTLAVRDSNVTVSGAKAELLVAENGADVTIAGDVQLNRVSFEQGTFNISGSLSMASAVFKSGNLSAKINHPDHHDVYDRKGGRWITSCPNNHVHYSLANALYPPHSEYGNIRSFTDAAKVALGIAADIKFCKANVEQYCIAPNVHTNSDTCRCGLFFGLLLLGSQDAVAYFARAAGADTLLSEVYNNIPKATLEDKLYEDLDKVAKRRDEPDMFDGFWKVTTYPLGDVYYSDGDGCVKHLQNITGLTNVGVLTGETITP